MISNFGITIFEGYIRYFVLLFCRINSKRQVNSNIDLRLREFQLFLNSNRFPFSEHILLCARIDFTEHYSIPKALFLLQFRISV